MFRYALERWHADAYDVAVLHRGSLNPEQQRLVRELDPEQVRILTPSSPGDRVDRYPANLTLRLVDLDANPPADSAELAKQLPTNTPLPALLVRYPRGSELPLPAWSGPLTGGAVSQLLESPVRRDLARRLLRGDSAVWVLLGSGNPALDSPAATVLSNRLQHLQNTLQLPKLDPADVEGGLVSVPEAELKVAFSMITVSRADPVEQVLVRLLLGIEDDLAASKEPIAFPVFGRGRALFALVGKGIEDENIDEACKFLTGPCSCQVKELNPGVDLLMSVDWDDVVSVASVDRAVPELSGLGGFGTSATSQARAPAEGLASGSATNHASASAGPAAASPGTPATPAIPTTRSRPMVVGLALAGGLGVLVVSAGTLLLLRRRT